MKICCYSWAKSPEGVKENGRYRGYNKYIGGPRKKGGKKQPTLRACKCEEGGSLFSSRLLVGLLIILVILGFGLWVNATSDVDPSSVQVAGAIISSVDMDLSVANCYLTEEESGRHLVVELEAKNDSGSHVEMDLQEFQLILVKSETPTLTSGSKDVYRPRRFTSTCEEAAASLSSIPPGTVRSISLYYYGGNLPQGDEWDDYYLSLEYHDPFTPLMLSKTLNPEGK